MLNGKAICPFCMNKKRFKSDRSLAYHIGRSHSRTMFKEWKGLI